jgi:hypothetical protein
MSYDDTAVAFERALARDSAASLSRV